MDVLVNGKGLLHGHIVNIVVQHIVGDVGIVLDDLGEAVQKVFLGLRAGHIVIGAEDFAHLSRGQILNVIGENVHRIGRVVLHDLGDPGLEAGLDVVVHTLDVREDGHGGVHSHIVNELVDFRGGDFRVGLRDFN